MFGKSILAVAALASALSLSAAAPAKADPSISFGIGFSSDPWASDYGPDPYFPLPRHHPHPVGYGDAGYGFEGGPWDDGWHGPRYGYRLSCSAGANVVRARGFHGVRPVDCTAPVYEYRAWKYGQPYEIQVSMRGRVIGASPVEW